MTLGMDAMFERLRRLFRGDREVMERLASLAVQRLDVMRRTRKTLPGDQVIERVYRETERIVRATGERR